VSAMSGASLASFAIRSSRVETILELGVSVIFPSNGSMIRRRPLLGGIPWVGSPASSLVLRRSDFPPPPLRSLALRSAVPRLRGGVGISQVPGEPSRACPALRPRRGRDARPFGPCPTRRRRDVAFRFGNGVGPRHHVNFEAQSHGLHARCVRFAAAVADVHATLASGWWPTLAGRDSNPLGSIVRFPLRHLSLPPHRSFAWRISNATVRSEVCRKRSGFGTRPLPLSPPFHALLAEL